MASPTGSKEMSEEIEEVRQKIDDMYDSLEEQTYYDLLDVDPELFDEKTVLKQFRLKAKDWHADRYSGFDLDADYRQKLQQIFAALNTAKQTLSDEEKRADYDFQLQAGDQDIKSIIDAEGAFRRGKNMLQTGSHKGAHEQFARAFELNPDENEYKAHVLYTEYLQIPKNDDGVPLKRTRASEIYEELDTISEEKPENDSVLTFLGVVATGLGKRRQAKRIFNEALQHNRQNVTAQRQLRLIRMREEREQNMGFFDKLLAKFRS
jgi:tetratricopeptide (TPR) repeat protein